jgi:hypothetical protein
MDLQKIRKELPYGAIKNIAKGVGVSPITVTQYFKGNLLPVKSVEILEEALKIIRVKKERELKVIAEIKALIS